MRPQPRRSFTLWKEEVRLHACMGALADLDAATQLRRDAVEVDLERQVGRARQAVAARDELVAIVSLDLRNPWSVIQLEVSITKRWSS